MAESLQYVPVEFHGNLAVAKLREQAKLAAKKFVAIVTPKSERSEAQQIAYQCGIGALAPVIQRLIDTEETIKTLQSRVDELEKKSAYPVHLKNVERR